MKIALICPSNILYMPYVSNYKNILNQKNVNYSVIKAILKKDKNELYQKGIEAK